MTGELDREGRAAAYQVAKLWWPNEDAEYRASAIDAALRAYLSKLKEKETGR